MKGLMNVAMAIFLLAIPLSVCAEYLIYIKGGHYIVADDCTFSSRQESEQEDGGERELVFVKDCTVGKPEGVIFWSIIDGRFGEIDANNVYAIYGGKGLRGIRPPRETTSLEDYLITNRKGSFVNAKIIEQREDHIYGVKRDDLAKIDRREVTEIAPEGVAKAGAGEGLCLGEPPEFSVSDLDLRGQNLIGAVTNLSSIPWRPLFEIEVHLTPPAQIRERARRSFVGKFRIEVSDELRPGDSIAFDARLRTQLQELVDIKLLEYVKRAVEPEGDFRLCAKKVRHPPGLPIAVSSPAPTPTPEPPPAAAPPKK